MTSAAVETGQSQRLDRLGTAAAGTAPLTPDDTFDPDPESASSANATSRVD